MNRTPCAQWQAWGTDWNKLLRMIVLLDDDQHNKLESGRLEILVAWNFFLRMTWFQTVIFFGSPPEAAENALHCLRIETRFWAVALTWSRIKTIISFFVVWVIMYFHKRFPFNIDGRFTSWHRWKPLCCRWLHWQGPLATTRSILDVVSAFTIQRKGRTPSHHQEAHGENAYEILREHFDCNSWSIGVFWLNCNVLSVFFTRN